MIKVAASSVTPSVDKKNDRERLVSFWTWLNIRRTGFDASWPPLKPLATLVPEGAPVALARLCR